jgi:hypothetical protein
MDEKPICLECKRLASTMSARKMNWCFLENVNSKGTVKSRRGHTENGRGEVAW